ncbi:hypothetical protein Syun_014939 [Stephania yunnanensis]|uniref:Uncharacterized protein n=1 Tax=Stephania yunnanensis TaxID=152371 RepID=A0AAP0PA32_9MAGN
MHPTGIIPFFRSFTVLHLLFIDSLVSLLSLCLVFSRLSHMNLSLVTGIEISN